MLRMRCVFNVRPSSLRFHCNISATCRRNISNHTKLLQHVSNSTEEKRQYKTIRKNYKTPMDPLVVDLEDKIIYCDHLHYDYVRLGHKHYTKIKNAIEYVNSLTKKNEMMYKPAKCITLQYLSKDHFVKPPQTSEESIQEEVPPVKPVHMPYATIDKVEVTETNLFTHDRSRDDTYLLNERYKLLYEKYLNQKALLNAQGKDVNLAEFLTQIKENVSADDVLEENDNDNWLKDYPEFNDASYSSLAHPDGTPDPNSSITPIPCGGCGALLHCKDPAIPGYLPSEILSDRSDTELKNLICKRCHFLKVYNTALKVNVSPNEYPELLRVIRKKICAVIVLVDLMDFPSSIWSELQSVLHPLTVLFVVGNKVDLLPKDQQHFETHVKNCLMAAVLNTGIRKNMVKYVGLVSAQTGYGIEELINKIQHVWGTKGDIYMIGCTNVGKSSLFNTFLQSDLCKSQATDVIQRATTSPWPGTTLNLLKFPLLNPQRWRMAMRAQRLKQSVLNKDVNEKWYKHLFRATERIKYATLQAEVGRTFKMDSTTSDEFTEGSHKENHYLYGLDENDPLFASSRWCYDTPGTMQSDQILDLFTTDELFQVLPRRIVLPRTFIFYPGQTAFLAGIGRLDYLNGDTYMLCTFFASDKLPFTMCYTQDADELYQKLLRTRAFVVPTNDPNRLEQWPALKSKDFDVTDGIDDHQSCADIVFSSAGWISLTPIDNRPVKLRAWTPHGRGLHFRTPPLLPYSVRLRGCRIDGTPLYTKGRQVSLGA